MVKLLDYISDQIVHIIQHNILLLSKHRKSAQKVKHKYTDDEDSVIKQTQHQNASIHSSNDNFKCDAIQNAIEKRNIIDIGTIGKLSSKLSNTEKESLIELIRSYAKTESIGSKDLDSQIICATIWYLTRLSDNPWVIENEDKIRIFTYLISIYTKIEDLNAKLFALINLAEWPLDKTEQSILQNYPTIFTQLKRWRNYYNFTNSNNVFQLLSTRNFEQLDYQLYFCLEKFYENVTNAIDGPQNLPSTATLNPNDRSAQLKLSSDLLSARSDSWKWQSIRSIPISNGNAIYYYEVVLLTDGPMSIGWSASSEEALANNFAIGDSPNSIGFDGFNQCVRHGGKQYSIQPITRQWMAGNVVGCAVDFAKQKFHFYLNGEEIHFSVENNAHFACDMSYCAAVSLSAHQQCYFNFGQVAYRYPPQNFVALLCSINDHTNQLCNLCNVPVESTKI